MNAIVDDALDAARQIVDSIAYRPRVAPVSAAFNLPRLRLNLHVPDQNYAGICTRALVDDSANAPALHEIDIHVVDPGSPDVAGEARLQFPKAGPEPSLMFGPKNGLHWNYDHERAVWQFFDRELKVGVQVMSEFSRMAPWETSFPLRRFLMWAYPSIGMHLVHAGSLGIGDAGVLLAGSGGAGKSGTTLAGVANGLTSVGDDYVAVDMTGPDPKARPVMRLIKQDAKGMDRVGLDPKLLGLDKTNWQDKYEFDFVEKMPTAKTGALKLRALFIPRVGGAERTSWVPANSREAMLALAPSNMREAMRTGLQDSAHLVRQLPAYFLDLGPNAEDIADCVRGFIETRQWSK